MNWKDLYLAALVEVDVARLLVLIRETEEAMTVRSESLATISNAERQAISDATCTLGILKSHALEQ